MTDLSVLFWLGETLAGTSAERHTTRLNAIVNGENRACLVSRV